jgi:hypothetical protein
MRLSPLILCGLLGVGCGDDASQPQPTVTDSATAADADADSGPSAFCVAVSARATTCGEPFDGAQCETLDRCYRSNFRPEESEPVANCVASRACGATTQSCLDEAAKKYAADEVVKSYAAACAARDTACGGGLAANVCTSEFALLNDTLRARVEGCLTRECGLVAECYQAALQSKECVR